MGRLEPGREASCRALALLPQHLGHLQVQGGAAAVEIFTDGAFESPDLPDLGGATVHWHRAGQRGRNVAITAFEARKTFFGAFDYQAFLSVANYGAEAVTFGDFNDDAFADDTPDWLIDGENSSSDSDSNMGMDDDDEFEQLRQKSTRSGSMYDEMETDNSGQSSGGSSFSWSSFSSGQRLVLALLIVLDILAIGFGVLVVAGIV